MAPIASPSARRILADGIEFLVVMVGAYGVGEVLSRLETGFATKPIEKICQCRTELPTMREMLALKGMFLRSSRARQYHRHHSRAPARPSPRS